MRISSGGSIRRYREFGRQLGDRRAERLSGVLAHRPLGPCHTVRAGVRGLGGDGPAAGGDLEGHIDSTRGMTVRVQHLDGRGHRQRLAEVSLLAITLGLLQRRGHLHHLQHRLTADPLGQGSDPRRTGPGGRGQSRRAIYLGNPQLRTRPGDGHAGHRAPPLVLHLGLVLLLIPNGVQRDGGRGDGHGRGRGGGLGRHRVTAVAATSGECEEGTAAGKGREGATGWRRCPAGARTGKAVATIHQHSVNSRSGSRRRRWASAGGRRAPCRTAEAESMQTR